MSASRRTAAESAPAASDVAAVLSDASFVRLVTGVSGDALAASCLLARALDDAGCPFQVTVARSYEFVERCESAGVDESVVAVGGTASAVDVALPAPASVTAFDAVREFGVTPDPVLALAGCAAFDVAYGEPGCVDRGPLLEIARSQGCLERRPGVAVPTADLADGLAHTTFAHTAFSGDASAAQATLAELDLPAELDGNAHRTVASLLALRATDAGEASERAADAVEFVLRPFATPDGVFATVGGLADVLTAVVRDRAGVAVALALGYDAKSDALDIWRGHARAAHEATAVATTSQFDGLFVVRTDDAPVETTARLVRDFGSPEPVALVVADGEAAIAATTDAALGDAMADAAAACDGAGGGSARQGYAQFDADATEFVDAFKEAR